MRTDFHFFTCRPHERELTYFFSFSVPSLNGQRGHIPHMLNRVNRNLRFHAVHGRISSGMTQAFSGSRAFASLSRFEIDRRHTYFATPLIDVSKDIFHACTNHEMRLVTWIEFDCHAVTPRVFPECDGHGAFREEYRLRASRRAQSGRRLSARTLTGTDASFRHDCGTRCC